MKDIVFIKYTYLSTAFWLNIYLRKSPCFYKSKSRIFFVFTFTFEGGSFVFFASGCHDTAQQEETHEKHLISGNGDLWGGFFKKLNFFIQINDSGHLVFYFEWILQFYLHEWKIFTWFRSKDTLRDLSALVPCRLLLKRRS